MSSDQGYYSKGYDKLISDSHAWRTVKNAVPFIIPYLKKTDRLLDVGLGPGTILKDLANYVDEVIGIEPTQELIDISSNQANLPEKVLFQLALAYNLPFEDESFDVVHALQVIVHLNEPETALREMYRVCKPGGYVLIKDADAQMSVIYPNKYTEAFDIFWSKHTGEGQSSLSNSGRKLKERAISVGYDPKKIEMNALTWCESTAEERTKWTNLFINRITNSKKIDYEADKSNLDKAMNLFKEWEKDEAGILILIHFEMAFHK